MSTKALLAALAALTACAGSEAPTAPTPGVPPASTPSSGAPPSGAAPVGAPPAIDQDVYPPCAGYLKIPEAYGYCIYKYAGGFPSAQEVAHFCPKAGAWERECRHSWVSGRMAPDSGYATEDLIEMCDGNPDCTFELLDFRPDDDVLVQIDHCGKWAGKYAPDCAGHAMQRWWLTHPDEEEFHRVASGTTRFPDKVGYYLGVSVACSHVGTCMGAPQVLRFCNSAVDHFGRKPGTCPPQVRAPMRPDNRPPPKGNGHGATPPSGIGTPPASHVAPAGAPGGQPSPGR